jgi:trimethylamine--corrinoid protein Co-methyltransferase
MQSPYALLDERTLSSIEAQADQILNEIGIELQDDPKSLEALTSLGARIDGQRARIDAGRLRDVIRQAPSSFVWKAKSHATSVVVGGGRPVLVPTYGPPNVLHSDGTLRQGTLDDYRALVRLCDASAALDSTGFLLCIAQNGHDPVSHLELARAHLELSDKPMLGTIISETALREVAEMVGVTDGQNECRLIHLINSTPPLVYQPNPLQCLRASAELGQASLVESYMMMGATAPVTIAGCLAQGLAEIMVGLALSQVYRPGSPAIGGIFATPFSMQYMGPVFGTPECHLAQMAGCQLVHRLGIPCRGDGMITSSKTNDAQAGYEGGGVFQSSVVGGADIILHTVGWLEFGRTLGQEKFASDDALITQSLAVDGDQQLQPA